MHTQPLSATPDDDGNITVTAAYTPASHIHPPESDFARYYTPPTLGPTAYLAWTQLVAWLPAGDGNIIVRYDEFAHGLGTSPARLTKALTRLAGFHLAHTLPEEPHVLHVKRRTAPLDQRQLARLSERCPTLAANHDQLHQTA